MAYICGRVVTCMEGEDGKVRLRTGVTAAMQEYITTISGRVAGKVAVSTIAARQGVAGFVGSSIVAAKLAW